MDGLCINKGVVVSMSGAIHARLETAVSTILVQLAYENLQKVDAGTLTISILIFYGCVQATTRFAVNGFQQQLMQRCQAVVLGLLGNVFLSCIQITASGATPSATRLVVPKLAVVACVLAFLGVLLHRVRGQFNLVGICLFVFSDSLKGQLESNRDSLVVVVVSAVVCAASPLLAKELEARVAGLSVLSSALFMATVNWLLDLTEDTSATAGGHCAMLLLLTVVLEVGKSVDPALGETQGYAIYRVTGVLAVYLRGMRVDWGVAVVAGLFALLGTNKLEKRWALAGLSAQIVLLVVVNTVVGEFRTAIAPLPVASKGIALASLLVSFEGLKFASTS